MKKILAITLVVLFSTVSTGFAAGDKVQGDKAQLHEYAEAKGNTSANEGEKLRDRHSWDENGAILLDLLEIFFP